MVPQIRLLQELDAIDFAVVTNLPMLSRVYATGLRAQPWQTAREKGGSEYGDTLKEVLEDVAHHAQRQAN